MIKETVKKPITTTKKNIVEKKLVIQPVLTNNINTDTELDNILPEDFPIEKELASKPDRYF